MTRTSLDDAQWTSLMLVIQRIPHAWKRDEAALRRFIEAVLWILRTGAPWRDLPDSLGHWPSVYHRWRRWCVRGWCELIFEHLRPMVPADGRGWPKVPPAEPVEWSDEGGAGRQHNLQGPS